MKIVFNGAERETAQTATVGALLESLGLDPRKVAVELNLEIVRRADYGTTPLAPGDRLEVVEFVGGG